MESINIQSAKSFGKAIRARRKDLGIRIDDAAAMCGISVSTLSAMENASRPIGFDKMLPVLAGLGLQLCIRGGNGHT